MVKEANDTLEDQTREDLNTIAENEGVESPEKLPNKEAVIESIEEESWSVSVTPTDIYSVKAKSYSEAVRKAKALHKQKRSNS